MKPCVVNIINFVRAVEPRNKSLDLLKPVKEQLKLQKKYNFPFTFLLQYDTLTSKEFVNLFEGEKENIELGLWLEMVQSLVEKVGIKWNGRPGFSWDYHVDPDFLIAYHKEQRKRLIDEAMMQFFRVFGHFPKVVGSWLLDSYSMNYLSSAYKIDAFCICREQYGTDGYTLWGGYYNQGYFPSKYNMLHPAQSDTMQLSTPTFRMLGVDPIYEYDSGLKEDLSHDDYRKQIYTFEPIWKTGKSPEWVDWYFNDVVKNECMSMSYVQIGQENSFGWDIMKDGYFMQMEKLKQYSEEGVVKIETLSATGRRFREEYNKSPATSMVALKDWKNEGHQTAWYYNSNYRINLMVSSDKTWIRDIQLFNENYMDPHFIVPATEATTGYYALPIIDGYLWSSDGKRAGIYMLDALSGGDIKCKITDSQKDGESLILSVLLNDKTGKIVFSENSIEVICPDIELAWRWQANIAENTTVSASDNSTLTFKNNNFSYKLKAKGVAENKDGSYTLLGKKLEFLIS